MTAGQIRFSRELAWVEMWVAAALHLDPVVSVV